MFLHDHIESISHRCVVPDTRKPRGSNNPHRNKDSDFESFFLRVVWPLVPILHSNHRFRFIKLMLLSNAHHVLNRTVTRRT